MSELSSRRSEQSERVSGSTLRLGRAIHSLRSCGVTKAELAISRCGQQSVHRRDDFAR